jgi:cytochrome c oxidase cbb3-type subunit 4
MDINDFRSWHTVVLFAAFIGIVIWAWSSKSKKRFNEAAQLPFNEPEFPPTPDNNKQIKGEHHE